MANADTLDGAGVNSGNALDAAKISKVFDTCKLFNKKIEKQRDFKAPQALSGDTELTARAANVLNSAAKVQNKSEITKLSKKKERAATVESQNTNLIARANSSSKHFGCKGTTKF